MEVTYESFGAELTAAIEKQQREVEEFGRYLQRQFESGRMSPGEPGHRTIAGDYERAEEYLQRLYSCAEDLYDRQEQCVPLGHPRDDVFVEELLAMID